MCHRMFVAKSLLLFSLAAFLVGEVRLGPKPKEYIYIYSLILGGDFNCWLLPVLDRSSTNPGVVSKSANFIQSFLANYGICDVWGSLHPNDREYSFFSRMFIIHTQESIIFSLTRN